MKKKNCLFKILAIIMVVIALLTWLIPAGYFSGEYVNAGINRLGFTDFCQYLILPFFQSMFLEVLIFLLSVGAFYGVLSKIGAYNNLIEKIAKKSKKKGCLFLIITACVFALLSSFGGYGLFLFIFIPAVVSIILLMGYDKIVALLTTFGAMLVGTIGATFGSNYISQTLSALGLTNETGLLYTAQILYKVILLVLSLVVLIVFTLKYANKNKVKNAEQDIPYLGVSDTKKKPIALYIVFGIMFVLLILGCTNWSEVFKIEVFSKFHEWLTGIEIAKFKIFDYLLGSSAVELGSWSYFQLSLTLILATLLIAKIYKVKAISNMVDGIKKIYASALLVVFTYGVLIIIANSGIFNTIMSFLFVKKFNAIGVIISMLLNILGSFLHVELPYLANFVLPGLVSNFTSSNVPAIFNVMSQALYGLTMFVAPTSLFLILGLTYLEVPYCEWLKKTWKLVLALFLLIIIVIIVMLLVL
jgi:uncharacterized ion transporter superfamily protein YfcC